VADHRACLVSASVHVERHGAVQVVTFDRPAVRNAFDRQLAEGVCAALDELERDDRLSVGILRGAGGNFSSGMDLRAFLRGELPEAGGHGLLGLVGRNRAKPLIAAVDGYALAAGFEVALACDLIVAAVDARFGLPEVTRSLVPAGGALLSLPRRVGLGVVYELALTGQPLDAARAFDLGLVSRLAPSGASLEPALELAGTIASNGPLAVEAIRAIIDRQRDWPREEFWQRQASLSDPVQGSADAAEGARAFTEHRSPVWRRA
jgi:enoyl-CoA hydratase